jgi:hypothetical protein
LQIRIRIVFASWIRICIRAKSWIRIRIKVKIQKLKRLITEPWRADFFDEEQDPDPDQN